MQYAAPVFSELSEMSAARLSSPADRHRCPRRAPDPLRRGPDWPPVSPIPSLFQPVSGPTRPKVCAHFAVRALVEPERRAHRRGLLHPVDFLEPYLAPVPARTSGRRPPSRVRSRLTEIANGAVLLRPPTSASSNVTGGRPAPAAPRRTAWSADRDDLTGAFRTADVFAAPARESRSHFPGPTKLCAVVACSPAAASACSARWRLCARRCRDATSPLPTTAQRRRVIRRACSPPHELPFPGGLHANRRDTPCSPAGAPRTCADDHSQLRPSAPSTSARRSKHKGQLDTPPRIALSSIEGPCRRIERIARPELNARNGGVASTRGPARRPRPVPGCSSRPTVGFAQNATWRLPRPASPTCRPPGHARPATILPPRPAAT